jgi:LPS export ABC transporter protein LptC
MNRWGGFAGLIRRVGPATLAFGLVAACTSDSTKPSLGQVVADSADQVLFKMSTIDSNDGVRRAIVYAETAFVYQTSQRMDLRRMRVTFFDEQGKQSSTLVANQGMYTITNGSLDARGKVQVQSTDGKRLETEHLIYDKTLMQVRGDTAFVYSSPTEHLVGNAFTSDMEFKNVRVQQPRGNQRGQGVIIPGQ